MECAAIALVVVGVVMATVTDSSVTTNLMGVVLSIAAILFSALYQVLSRICLPADLLGGPASTHPPPCDSILHGTSMGYKICSMKGVQSRFAGSVRVSNLQSQVYKCLCWVSGVDWHQTEGVGGRQHAADAPVHAMGHWLAGHSGTRV